MTAHRLRVEALRDAAREGGCDLEHAAADRCFSAAWDRHMTLWGEGVATGARDVARWALESLGIGGDGAALPYFAGLVEHFEEASHSSRVTALPDARATLSALHDVGIRCGLVCDTGLTPGRVVRRHLDRLGLLPFLESQAFSDEVGVPKPQRQAFEAALSPLGVAPTQAVHVGDLRATDVAGARALGMVSVRLRAAHDDEAPLPDADFVADSHVELRALLVEGPPALAASR